MQDAKESTSIVEEAKAYAEEVFDDEEDRSKFVDTVNRLVDVPYVGEAVEGMGFDKAVDLILRAYRSA